MGYASHNKGKFTPKNPEKYKGDISNIVFRSSWELHMNKFLDTNPNIIEWSSEPFGIPYVKATDGKVHKYFFDYWIKYKDANGNIIQEIIEVKPYAQTIPPKAPKRKSKSAKAHTRLLKEQATYAVNISKWRACQAFCDKHGFKFRIITEQQLFR